MSSVPVPSAPSSSLATPAPVDPIAVLEEAPLRSAWRRSGWLPWLRLMLIWLVIAVSAAVLMRVPLPLLGEHLGLRNLLVVAVSILLAGKALYDTLFYDRCPV